MRSFISTVILSLFMFVGMSFAQENVPDEGAATTSESVSVAKAEKGKIAHIEKKWYIGGTEVSPDAVVATLNSNLD